MAVKSAEKVNQDPKTQIQISNSELSKSDQKKLNEFMSISNTRMDFRFKLFQKPIQDTLFGIRVSEKPIDSFLTNDESSDNGQNENKTKIVNYKSTIARIELIVSKEIILDRYNRNNT